MTNERKKVQANGLRRLYAIFDAEGNEVHRGGGTGPACIAKFLDNLREARGRGAVWSELFRSGYRVRGVVETVAKKPKAAKIRAPKAPKAPKLRKPTAPAPHAPHAGVAHPPATMAVSAKAAPPPRATNPRPDAANPEDAQARDELRRALRSAISSARLLGREEMDHGTPTIEAKKHMDNCRVAMRKHDDVLARILARQREPWPHDEKNLRKGLK